MYSKSNKLTHEEYVRLNEILFYNLIQNLFKKGKNPTKLLHFVEVICEVADISNTVVNSVVLSVMQEERSHKPKPKEHAMLLSRAAVPVRRICKQFGMSNTTYYKLLKEQEANPISYAPTYSEPQCIAIIKFLDTVESLTDLTERI